MVASRSFSTQAASVPHLSKGEIADLRSDVEEGFKALESEVAEPITPGSQLLLDVQPTEGDFITIGTDKYEWVDTAGAGVEAGAHEVLTGADAAEALANVVASINENATINVVASVYNTNYLLVQKAKFPGGPIDTGNISAVLAESLTDSEVWANDNLSEIGGEGEFKKARFKIAVTTANLATTFDLIVPGVPVAVSSPLATDDSDVPDTTGKGASVAGACTIVQARNAVTVDLDGGDTDPVDTDIVYLDVLYLR